MSVSGLLTPLPTWDQDQADIPVYYCETDLSLQLSKCLEASSEIFVFVVEGSSVLNTLEGWM